MTLKYTSDQHKNYLAATRKIGTDWVEVFQGNSEFYSTDYWDLFTEMWFVGKPIMVSDALKFMKAIKSPYTARKYLQKVIDEKLVIETKNPNDDRSTLVSLSPDMKSRLDNFFDITVENMCTVMGGIGK